MGDQLQPIIVTIVSGCHVGVFVLLIIAVSLVGEAVNIIEYVPIKSFDNAQLELKLPWFSEVYVVKPDQSCQS